MPGKPYQSKLNQYIGVIKQLRKENISYCKIAEIMARQYGVSVTPATIHSFVKVRSKIKKVYTIREDLYESRIDDPDKMDGTKFDFDKFVNNQTINKTEDNTFNFDENSPIK